MSTQAANSAFVHGVVPPPSPIPVPDDVLQAAERLGVAEQLPQAISIAREILGDRLTMRVTEDPELEDWTHIVIEGPVNGTVEEAVAKDRACRKLMVRQGMSRLFIVMSYFE